MERGVMAEAIVRGGAYAGLAQCNESSLYRNADVDPNEIAKIKAEKEKRETEWKRQAEIAAIVEFAERLVMSGKSPEVAFEIANDFGQRAKAVKESY